MRVILSPRQAREKFSVVRIEGGDVAPDDEGAKSATETFSKQNRSTKLLTVELRDGRAFEIAVDGDQGRARARFFARDGSMYVMVVEYPPDPPASMEADVDRFFASFKRARGK